MDGPEFRYLVETSGLGQHERLYDGTDVADAMAAFSRAISDGVEYVALEGLRPTGKTWEGS